jgi:hypothetical protein
MVAGVCAVVPASAQSSQNTGYGVGNADRGLVVGVIVGVAVVIGASVTYLVLHNRGVAVGWIAESGGKKTLGSDKKVYSPLNAGPSLPVGERAKLKGHKSGPASAPSFQVEKVLKNYGHCQP